MARHHYILSPQIYGVSDDLSEEQRQRLASHLARIIEREVLRWICASETERRWLESMTNPQEKAA